MNCDFIVLYVFITEVEKQLQGEIPLLAYKKSQTGSTGNIHGLVLASEQSSSGITQGNIECYIIMIHKINGIH